MAALTRSEVAYGFSQSLLGVLEPIIARRNPTSADKAALGTPWINKVNNTYYVCTSVTNNAAFWAAGAAAPANLVAAGFITAGTTLTSGTNLVVGTTAVIGTGLTVTAGNGTLSNGNLVINHDVKGITWVGGSSIIEDAAKLEIESGAGMSLTCAAAASLEVVLGDALGATALQVFDSALALASYITSNGDVYGTQISAAGDDAGIAATNSLTGIVNGDPISTGVASIKNTTAVATTNAGWIKMYVGVTPVWVPYFDAEVA
jgi:hypothetical protein